MVLLTSDKYRKVCCIGITEHPRFASSNEGNAKGTYDVVLHSPLDRTGLAGADAFGIVNMNLFTVTIGVDNE
jgi:hypothetical protein